MLRRENNMPEKLTLGCSAVGWRKCGRVCGGNATNQWNGWEFYRIKGGNRARRREQSILLVWLNERTKALKDGIFPGCTRGQCAEFTGFWVMLFAYEEATKS